MPTRGRKPVPTAIKRLNGNPGNRPLKDDDIKFEAVKPPPPDDLTSDVAKAKWDEMADMLTGYRLLSKLDLDALRVYCEAFAQWTDAVDSIQKTGWVVKAPKSGHPMLNPYMSVKKDAEKKMADFHADFGLTPSARTRVKGSSSGGKGKDEKRKKASRLFN